MTFMPLYILVLIEMAATVQADAVLELATKLVVKDKYQIRAALQEAAQANSYDVPSSGKEFAAWRSRVSNNLLSGAIAHGE